MKHTWLKIGLVLTAVVLCSSHLKGSLEMTQIAQSQGTQAGQQEFEFRPQVVQLQAELLNCQARGGGIRVNFKGTDLMPNVSGDVKAKCSQGSTLIEAKFENLPSPTTLGELYMTYVLWTMTAKDRPVRIGELEVKDPAAALTSGQCCRFWRCSSPQNRTLTFPSRAILSYWSRSYRTKCRRQIQASWRKRTFCAMHTRRWDIRMSRWWSVSGNR